MIAPAEAVAAIPDGLSAPEAAPLPCAGITVLNGLRNAGAQAGDTVAVEGIGGLGHLGIQYARQMGLHTLAIGRGGDKAVLAKKLGAHEYIDTAAGNAAEAMQKLGGADLILATAPESKAISALVDGLGPNGKLLVIGASFEPLSISPVQLIAGAARSPGGPWGPLRILRTRWSLARSPM